MRRLIILVTITSLFIVCGIVMADTGEKAIAEIRLSIEKSALSQETKAVLLKNVYEAVNAGIPSDDIAIIINRSLRYGVDGKTIEGFIDTAIKVKRQNLPTRPVLDRIQQGLSKGVPPERILGATRKLAEKLSVAEGIVNNLIKSDVKTGNTAEKGELVQTVARALERSIPKNIITQIGINVRKHNYSLSIFDKAVDTVTNFVESGMSVELASRLVNKAIDKGYSEKDMWKMEREIADELKEGRKMEDVARRMESVMDRGFERSYRGMEGGQMRGTGSGMGSGSSIGSSGMGSGSGMGGSSGFGGGSRMQRR